MENFPTSKKIVKQLPLFTAIEKLSYSMFPVQGMAGSTGVTVLLDFYLRGFIILAGTGINAVSWTKFGQMKSAGWRSEVVEIM